MIMNTDRVKIIEMLELQEAVHAYTLRRLATLQGALRPFYVLDGMSDSEAARMAVRL